MEHLRRRVVLWAVAGALAVVTFGVEFSIAQTLDAHGDLKMLNRFFDADCPWYVVNFETGKQYFGSYAGRSPVHPNVANLVHPLVAGLAFVVRGGRSAGVEASMHLAALTIAPLLAGARSGFLFLALAEIGFQMGSAALVTVLSMTSFSGVLFGALPESFGISGALFAFGFYLLARALRTGVFQAIDWGAGLTLTLGTTVTNAIPFGMMMAVAAYGVSGRIDWSMRKLLKIGAGAVAATVILFVALTGLEGSFRGAGLRRVGQLEEIRPSLHAAVVSFPVALADTLVAPRPRILLGVREPAEMGTAEDANEVRARRFTFRGDIAAIFRDVPTIKREAAGYRGGKLEIAGGLLLICGVGLSFLSWRALTRQARVFLAAACLVLLFHWALHSLFGFELFLYSQHWLAALVIVAGMALRAGGTRARIYAASVVAALCFAAGFASYRVLGLIFATH